MFISYKNLEFLLTCDDAKTFTENIFKNWSACEVDSGWQKRCVTGVLQKRY